MLAGQSPFKRAEMRVTVTRADGRVEDYGVVSRYHKNRVIRLVWNLQDKLRMRRLVRRYRA